MSSQTNVTGALRRMIHRRGWIEPVFIGLLFATVGLMAAGRSLELRAAADPQRSGGDNIPMMLRCDNPIWSPDGSKILFLSNRRRDGTDAPVTDEALNVWVMNADGSNQRPLTKLSAFGAQGLAASISTGVAGPASWSPDSRKIAFSSWGALDSDDAVDKNNAPNIWLMNADGSGQMPLTRLIAAHSSSLIPVWSPDGHRIAFLARRALNGSDSVQGALASNNIWVMDADGHNAVPLTRLTMQLVSAGGLLWSPDGNKILFISNRALDGGDGPREHTSNIWVMNADGSDQKPLTKFDSANVSAYAVTWSPDGAKIAFVSTLALDGSSVAKPGMNGNIWVMNADGSKRVPLTKVTAIAGSLEPLWSPDGSKIAFESVRAVDGSDGETSPPINNIWVINVDGSGLRALTTLTVEAAESLDPSWSPNGRALVFSSGRALDGGDAANAYGSTNIWAVNADGSGAKPLTKLTGTGPVAQPR